MQQSNQQLHLTVPEQPTHLVNDESPIDRYGPLSRGVTDSDTYPRLSGRSSCYSRDTDEYSLYGGVERRESVRQDYVDGIPIGYSRDTDEYSLYRGVERRENGRQEYVDGIPIGDIQRPTPVHLSVNTARYTTQHGNESKLIIQGLSDPYKTGSSPVSARQEVNAVDDSSWRMYSSSELGLKPIWPLRIDSRNPREQSPVPSPRRQNWQTAEWPGSKSIERPSVPPIRPERWSAVSPSFRTPTSLVSPFKRPPSIVISTIGAGSTSQLGKYSTGPKSPYSNSHRRYPPKMDTVLIGIAVALATFCTAMDRVIIPTAVPAITDQFNTIEDIGWYGTSYLLTACSTQLLYGKLYQFYTAKWVYIAALAVFELGSIVSGAASVSPLIIFGRALAGVGAAGVLSGSVLILGQCVRLGQKTVYFGILAGVHGVVLVIGPLLGGILTQYASWRWCFFINIPFGLISCILLVASNWDGPRNASSQSTPQDKLALLDLEGTLLFLPSIVCLLLALQWGGVEYPWTSASEIVLFAVFLVTIIGFILIQYYKNELASIPPRIFLNRNVYGGMLTSFCLGGSIALVVYYLPLWFQVTENASPLQSGVLLLPLVLTLAITSIASASLVNIVGYYTPFLVFASVVMSISSGLLTTLEDSTPVSAWIGYQILFGLGAGSGIHQTALGIQASFQKHRDIAVGTVMITFAQTLGAAVAIGMGQSVFENSLVNGIQAARLGDVSVQRVLHTGAMDLRKVFDGNDLDTVLHLYTHAIDQAFYVSVGFTTVSILGVLAMEWSSVRGRRAPIVLG